MKKEVLVAILLGLGIGVVVTFGISTARRALLTETVKPQGPTIQTPDRKSDSSSAVEIEKKHSLTVTSPADGSVETTEKITLTGTTTSGSTVAITGGETDTIINVDEKGQFLTEITLVGGDNEIRVTSFSPAGEKAETVLTVVYSTAEF